MSTISVRIPDSVYRRVKELAAEEHLSINQFINSAVAEKLSAFLTEEYLEQRAAHGDRVKFEGVMSKVPDGEPMEGDEL
jgi:predicted transcriptional regulator